MKIFSILGSGFLSKRCKKKWKKRKLKMGRKKKVFCGSHENIINGHLVFGTSLATTGTGYHEHWCRTLRKCLHGIILKMQLTTKYLRAVSVIMPFVCAHKPFCGHLSIQFFFFLFLHSHTGLHRTRVTWSIKYKP